MHKKAPWKQRFSILALIALALVVTSCFPTLETRTPSIEIKESAPDFSLPTHDEQEVTLDSLLEDGPAVLVFYRGYW